MHATDVSNASRTMLFDIHTDAWDDELLRAARRAARAAAARCIRRATSTATTDARACSARPIPIGGVAGDQQSALFGQACFRPGLAKNTYGTGCFMLMHTGAAFADLAPTA